MDGGLAATSELDGLDLPFRLFHLHVQHFGVEQRVLAFKQHHPPFPIALHYHKFSVGLIDGNHYPPSVTKDFEALNFRVTDYLLFDNVEQPYIAGVVKRAVDKEGWRLYEEVEYTSDTGGQKKFVALRR